MFPNRYAAMPEHVDRCEMATLRQLHNNVNNSDGPDLIHYLEVFKVSGNVVSEDTLEIRTRSGRNTSS